MNTKVLNINFSNYINYLLKTYLKFLILINILTVFKCNICRNSILDSDHVAHMIRSSIITSLRFVIDILISITSVNQSSMSVLYVIIDKIEF